MNKDTEKLLPKSGKVETAGDLRQFLCNMIVGIKSGDLEIGKAAQITKMAEQVTNSLYAEIKLQQMAVVTGSVVEKIGTLNLGKNDEKNIIESR